MNHEFVLNNYILHHVFGKQYKLYNHCFLHYILISFTHQQVFFITLTRHSELSSPVYSAGSQSSKLETEEINCVLQHTSIKWWPESSSVSSWNGWKLEQELISLFLPVWKCLYLGAFILSLVVMASTRTWYTWHTARHETQTQWNSDISMMKRTQGAQVAASLTEEVMVSWSEYGQAPLRYE